MTIDSNLQERLIALIDSAERILPNSPSNIDWETSLVAKWVEQLGSGYLQSVEASESAQLNDLLGIDKQKSRVVTNTKQLLAGLPANNVLLWGARGTGKSSVVKALLHEFSNDGLRIIQVDKHQLRHLPSIVSSVLQQAYKFIVYCDDLSFDDGDTEYKVLKSALDGALFSMPDHIVIYATSNRRHLLPEYHLDNTPSTMANEQVHFSDVVEEKISLSDRFGLWLSFYPMEQQQYLFIVEHWVLKLAQEYRQALIFDDLCKSESLKWALGRGTRSGRTAYQFARHWVGLQLLQE